MPLGILLTGGRQVALLISTQRESNASTTKNLPLSWPADFFESHLYFKMGVRCHTPVFKIYAFCHTTLFVRAGLYHPKAFPLMIFKSEAYNKYVLNGS